MYSMMIEGPEPVRGLVAVFGRMHPLILHVPIGVLSGLALVEVSRWFFGGGDSRRAPGALVWLAALSAAAAMASGLVLNSEGTYSDDAVTPHMRLGVVFTILIFAAALVHTWYCFSKQKLQCVGYFVLLATAFGVMIPTGHLGAGLTHGDEFLTAPLGGGEEASSRKAAAPAAAEEKTAENAASSYAAVIAPILEARCYNCHGAEQQKAKLALHEPALIRKGGKSGAALDAAHPAEGLLLARVKLGLEEKGHMPPKNKPQPTEAELTAIEAWITAGAPFEGAVPAVTKTASAAAAATKDGARVAASREPELKEPKGEAPAAALAALREKLVHVQALAQGSSLLWIDFSAPALRTGDAEVQSSLTPLRAYVAELSLSRTKISDAALETVAQCPNLKKLDLRATAVTDAGVEKLRGNATIETLILAQTKVTDAAVDALLTMPKLKKLFLWGSGITASGIETLKKENDHLEVDDGAKPDAAKEETEAAPKLTNGPPAPAAPTASAPPKPVNAVCPVSGQPVDPKYQIVFEGKVVGFCCPNCPGKFWAHPEEFRAKLP